MKGPGEFVAHSVKRQDLPNSKFALYSWTSAKILTNGATSISKDEVSKLGASGACLLEDYLEQPHQFVLLCLCIIVQIVKAGSDSCY